MPDSESPLDFRTFADKLAYLFETVHPREKKPYTYREVSDAIAAEQGADVSVSYLYLLRSGRRDNPGLHQIKAISQFFGVPPSYFLDSAESKKIREELTFIATMRDARIKGIAMRSVGLSDGSLATVQQIIEQVRSLEGLPPQNTDHAESSDEDSGAP